MSTGSYHQMQQSTAYHRFANFDRSQISVSDYEDRNSLSSSPSTQDSDLLLRLPRPSVGVGSAGHPNVDRRATARSKRRSWRFSATSSSSSSSSRPLQVRAWSSMKAVPSPSAVARTTVTSGLAAALNVPTTTTTTSTVPQSRQAQRRNDAMVYLQGPRVYSCGNCRTHLTSHDDIVSKSFHGRHGRAYLFQTCVNVTHGPSEQRRLITGLHTVCDIFCRRCSTLVGWTYLKAHESSQKYKEGKFIVEKVNLHDEEEDAAGGSDQDKFAPRRRHHLASEQPMVRRSSRHRSSSSRWEDDDDDHEASVFEYEVSSS